MEVGFCQGRNQAGELRIAGESPQMDTPECEADKAEEKRNTGLGAG